MDEAAVSYQVVLTKADKLKPTELARMRQATADAMAKHAAAYPVLLATSSQTAEGIGELRAEIARIAKQ
jgi:GTP-binding protein